MDYDAQEKLINQRLANYRSMQGQQMPQAKIVGNRYVAPNPLEYLAVGLREYGGMRGQKFAEQELADLQKQKQEAVAKALREFGQKANPTQLGTGATNLVNDALPPELRMGAMPAIAPRKPDMVGAYDSLINSGIPELQQAGMRGMIQMPENQAQQQAREEERAFKQQEAQAIRDAKMQQLQEQHAQRMEFLQEQNATRQQMAEEQRQFQLQMAQVQKQMSQAQPYFQPVQTAQGVMAFNARTGNVAPVIGADGTPIIGAAADPNLQGALAGAKTTATEQAKSTLEAKGEARKSDMFLQQLSQAEEILKQGPTQSGAGAVLDAAGRAVGVSTPGAQRAGQLEALSGWLVANVPRMEGPQSNFDVQNYMTMAGKIGDRTVPVQERLAALNEVRRLQEKYKASAEQRSGAQTTPQTAKPRIRFDAQGNIIQ